ncbi:MAG: HD-GYP domain-containing protein [Spirochaetia bacterium]|jgi:HD-GYP domain-containing protein (c-di-GMP phosphodiesterase class II)|nr:HD-GYP domain-containing protein [Spirochaetia bacterium]
MDNQNDNLIEAEELVELVELEEENNLTGGNYEFKESSGSGLLAEADLPFRHLKVMENLKSSEIPAIILDKRLNIIWENNSYKTLFLNNKRNLPVNMVQDFFPFLTTERIGIIYKSIRNKVTGYSFKIKVESKHRDRLDIIANLIINPFTERRITTEKDSIPEFFIGIFDDISEGNKALLEKTFLSLLEASKLKDNDTGNHIKRVGAYSKVIAIHLFNNPSYPGVNTEFIENIFFLAPMHDVGKIGTPDDILTKPGALNDLEWKIMKEHTINGAYILRAYPDPMATQIAIFHHEKWNGTGYPYGINNTDIPLPARIISIADVYDALRMKRSYKSPFSHEKAIDIITKDSGSHFDPDLVNIFIENNSKFETIYEDLKDS